MWIAVAFSNQDSCQSQLALVAQQKEIPVDVLAQGLSENGQNFILHRKGVVFFDPTKKVIQKFAFTTSHSIPKSNSFSATEISNDRVRLKSGEQEIVITPCGEKTVSPCMADADYTTFESLIAMKGTGENKVNGLRDLPITEKTTEQAKQKKKNTRLLSKTCQRIGSYLTPMLPPVVPKSRQHKCGEMDGQDIDCGEPGTY